MSRNTSAHLVSSQSLTDSRRPDGSCHGRLRPSGHRSAPSSPPELLMRPCTAVFVVVVVWEWPPAPGIGVLPWTRPPRPRARPLGQLDLPPQHRRAGHLVGEADPGGEGAERGAGERASGAGGQQRRRGGGGRPGLPRGARLPAATVHPAAALPRRPSPRAPLHRRAADGLPTRICGDDHRHGGGVPAVPDAVAWAGQLEDRGGADEPPHRGRRQLRRRLRSSRDFSVGAGSGASR